MQKTIFITCISLFLLFGLQLKAHYENKDTSYRKWFVGSTLFVLGNLSKDNTPDFAQVDVGYRLTGKDVISFELKSWKYAWPMGIPYGNSFEASEERFPGFIREHGFTVAYQRFLWKELYAGMHVMNTWQSFYNEDNTRVEKGFQIYNTYRAGYHFRLFKDRLFIEPFISATHRRYHIEMPDGFKLKDDNPYKFFLGERDFHFGFNV